MNMSMDERTEIMIKLLKEIVAQEFNISQE